jgi:hypothetical protein
MTFRHLRNVRGFFSDYYLGSVLGRGAGRGARKIASDRGTDQAYDRFRRIRERAEGRADDAPDLPRALHPPAPAGRAGLPPRRGRKRHPRALMRRRKTSKPPNGLCF